MADPALPFPITFPGAPAHPGRGRTGWAPWSAACGVALGLASVGVTPAQDGPALGPSFGPPGLNSPALEAPTPTLRPPTILKRDDGAQGRSPVPALRRPASVLNPAPPAPPRRLPTPGATAPARKAPAPPHAVAKPVAARPAVAKPDVAKPAVAAQAGSGRGSQTLVLCAACALTSLLCMAQIARDAQTRRRAYRTPTEAERGLNTPVWRLDAPAAHSLKRPRRGDRSKPTAPGRRALSSRATVLPQR